MFGCARSAIEAAALLSPARRATSANVGPREEPSCELFTQICSTAEANRVQPFSACRIAEDRWQDISHWLR